MKKLLVATVFCVLLTACAQPSAAKLYTVPGLSVWDPVQYPSRDESVGPLRLNVFYGRNENLTGLDLGILFPINLNTLNGRLLGIQVGSYNEVGDDSVGFQWGVVNYARQDFWGVQYGVGNITGGVTTGGQVGFINRTEILRGVQIGVFNYAEYLNGVQIGLSNLRTHPPSDVPNTTPFRFFPVVNWSF